MLEVMKLIGNLSAGLGTGRNVHLNFSRDALLATLFQAKKSINTRDISSAAELDCRDIILLAEELIKTTATGSEDRKRYILANFILRYGLQADEVDDIGRILLV
jgi:hypothetical protein